LHTLEHACLFQGLARSMHRPSSPTRRSSDLAWETPPAEVDTHWAGLAPRFKRLTDKYPQLLKTNNYQHLGTLGTGNHFIEVCLEDRKSTRLNSSHVKISYAVFCLKKNT